MKAVILTAYRGDGEGYGGSGWRDRAWTLVRDQLDPLPWKIVAVDSGDSPFNISKSYNQAAEEAGDWDVAVIHPPDEWVPHTSLIEAIRRVNNNVVYAFDHEIRLTEEGTEALYAGEREFGRDKEHLVAKRRNAPMPAYGGPRVIARSVWDEIGGFDDSVIGWGGEDRILTHCADILGRKHERVEGVMLSPYHPRHEESDESGFFANQEQNQKYMKKVLSIKSPAKLRKHLA